MKEFEFKLQKINGFNSIKRGNRKLTENNFFDSIVIVGSSGSGKTTLIKQLRNIDKLSIPQRLITRPPRKDDDIVENKYISETELLNLAETQKLLFHWTRKMENNREEKYAIVKIQTDAIPLISGNNALFNNFVSVRPQNILDNSLFIGIYAPDEVRLHRLQERSPDLFSTKPNEINYRLGDSSNNIIEHSHIIINNYGDNEILVLQEFYKFILNLIQND